MAIYRRILLKLSGEALKSDSDLFDFDKVRQVADYSMPNVGEKVVKIILSYTDYIRRRVWMEN